MDRFIKPLPGVKNKWVVDYGKINSYNADWVIINSERGPGKTFGVLKEIMVDICKHLGDKQMVLVARRLNELRQATEDNGSRFLGDLWEKTPWLYENFVYRKRKEFFIEIAKRKFDEDGNPKAERELEWYTAVNMLYLSGNIRRSVAYNKVDYVLFDEFQIVDEGGTYVKGEYKKFMNLLSTIMRDRKVKVYMLSNSGSIINPYFSEMGYRTPEQEVWTKTVKMPGVDSEGNDVIRPVKMAIFNLQIDPDKLQKDNIAGAFGKEMFSGGYNLTRDYLTKLNETSRIMFNFQIDNVKYSCYNSLEGGKPILLICGGFNQSANYTLSDTFLTGQSLRGNLVGDQLRDAARANMLFFNDITTREHLLDFVNKLF